MTSSNMWHTNDDQLAPNFDIAYKTIQRVSIPNLKLFGPTATELWGKEVGEFSIMFCGKMGWWALFCPPTWLLQYKCIEIL